MAHTLRYATERAARTSGFGVVLSRSERKIAAPAQRGWGPKGKHIQMTLMTNKQLHQLGRITEQVKTFSNNLADAQVQIVIERLRELEGGIERPSGLQFVNGARREIEEFIQRHGDAYQWYLQSNKGYYSQIPSAELTISLFQVLERCGFRVVYTEKA